MLNGIFSLLFFLYIYIFVICCSYSFFIWLSFCRQEMKLLHKEAASSSKERLTIDWFSQTVTELRSELAELQQASSNASRSMQQHNSVVREEVAEMKNEFRRVNLELSALKVRQETTERIVKDLRADAIEYGSDNKRAKVSEHVLYMCVLYSFFPRGTTFMVIRLICLMN